MAIQPFIKTCVPSAKGSKLSQRNPYKFSEYNRTHRENMCSSLLSRFTNEPLSDTLVTGDEKRGLYKNVKCRKQYVGKEETLTPSAKEDLLPRKVL